MTLHRMGAVRGRTILPGDISGNGGGMPLASNGVVTVAVATAIGGGPNDIAEIATSITRVLVFQVILVLALRPLVSASL